MPTRPTSRRGKATRGQTHGRKVTARRRTGSTAVAPRYIVEGSRTTHVVLPFDEYERLMLADIALEGERLRNDPNTKWVDYDDYRAKEAANRLAAVRKSKGMTQQQLANKLGMAQTQISRLERNPDRTTLRTLKRVAKALGVDLPSLVG